MAFIRSISGLRATLGDDLTPARVAQYATALAALLPDGPIVLGRDGRPSGVWIEAIMIGSLQACGRTVRNAGMVPTPTVQLLTEHSDAVGGVIITASHNPEAWNGLKFLDHDGVFFDADMNARLWHNVDTGYTTLSTEQQHGAVESITNAIDEHVQRVLHLDAVQGAPLAHGETVVVDAVHASGSVIIPTLLRSCGYNVVELYCNGSGIFPHTPEPLPIHLGALAAAVVEHGAAFGVAVDPDADRLVLINEHGQPIGEECTIALATLAVLDAGVRGPVVVNYSTSRMVDAVAAKYDTLVHRAGVGEINVVGRMRHLQAVIGGEGSGGVIYPACHMGRDSVVALGLITALLRRRGWSMQDAVNSLPSLGMIKQKIDLEPGLDVGVLFDTLSTQLASDANVSREDGVYAAWPDAWIHVRASNTEPIVRIIAEAPTLDQAQHHIDTVRTLLLTPPGTSAR